MTPEKPLHFLTIHEAQGLIRSRQLSPVELTRAVLARIDAVDGELRAYLKLFPERALEEARRAEAEIVAGGHRGPLHGIPIAVKDQLDVEGAPALIRGPADGPSADATAVRRLRAAGAVILGKLHMSSLPGDPPPPRNPWNPAHITGGSSTGSGAAVAAGLCLGALGEDTAGSIRNPASLCGIVGLKPTYGRVSRHGLAPLSWSLDHCGPMTWVVEDAAYMLEAIAGFDPADPTSIEVPVPRYSETLREGVAGTVIGVPREYIESCRIDRETRGAVDRAIAELASLGAKIEEVSAPSLQAATVANAVIYYNEYFTAKRAELQRILDSGPPARRARVYLGVLTSASDYIQAQRLRSRLRRELQSVFARVDLMALPCQSGPAPRFEETTPFDTFYKHLAPDFHSPFNLAGLPAISVPCGFSPTSLPVALQLVAKPFDEPGLLRAAYTYQQHARLYTRRPPV
jgi:aspartyl-tRNA(Asn)/glutamyl-tRNA(Gln) amidotransferase subunit A